MTSIPGLQDFAEGRHHRLWEVLGAHIEGDEVRFAVWAPHAQALSVIGDFNDWVASANPLVRDDFGVWHGTVAGIGAGELYQFEITTADGERLIKSDPFARFAQLQPQRSSVVYASSYQWDDDAWLVARAERHPHAEPM
ncbi:MAG: GlgB N-terminal domain-containing protein, partial [Aeromicrobium sp.]